MNERTPSPEIKRFSFLLCSYVPRKLNTNVADRNGLANEFPGFHKYIGIFTWPVALLRIRNFNKFSLHSVVLITIRKIWMRNVNQNFIQITVDFTLNMTPIINVIYITSARYKNTIDYYFFFILKRIFFSFVTLRNWIVKKCLSAEDF